MADVQVTVETPTENQIVEVTYDGQEIVQPPLTQGEHLTRMAAKLDFDAMSEDMDKDDEAEPIEESSEPQAKDAQQPAKWPWESVRDRLREALVEVSVLSDVISVATKDCGRDQANNPKRYMILDGPTTADPPEQRPYVSLVAKKKFLESHVSKILLNGADHLKALQNENRPGEGGSRTANFHAELLNLRKYWRLKKVSNSILGDLSFRTAGSQFKPSGIFEVVKADEDDGPASSVLKVNIPSELEGIAFIQVGIQRESELIVSANVNQQSVGSGAFDAAMAGDVHWQKKLEQAQNVIFCKELFAQLAKEAIQLQAPVPHMVVGNQISCSLFPDIQLLITLRYETGSERKTLLSKMTTSSGGNEDDDRGAPSAPPQPDKEHSHVLEHSLHQLLKKAHRDNLNPERSGLSSSPVGVSKRRRMAGPRAADRRTLLKMANEETFLEQIILQAQHVVLRLRTMFVLDTLASMKDPLITFHWNTLSSPTRTSVKVNIVTAGYDAIQRTQLVIHVYAKTLTFVCKDGRVLHFSHEPQELRDFMLCQISQHQINAVQALAKCTGWHVLSSSTYHLGCGSVEPLGNATGCLLSSPIGDKYVAVRHSPNTSGHGGFTSVYVASAPANDFFPGSLVSDRKWESLPETFQEVRVDKMEGKNLLNKLELLMAALSPTL